MTVEELEALPPEEKKQKVHDVARQMERKE